MKKPSDAEVIRAKLQESIIGLGERSIRKSYYPELQQRIIELERANAELSNEIAERKLAEVEKEKMQSQLIQSQKIESVGRLAGGVAHDYNNMLGVILGHTDLALLKTDDDHPLHDHLKAIRHAAQRSAELTQQLLAFARRQTIAPQMMDLNAAVTTTLQMLQLLIGEDIVLDWLPGAEPYPVKIDPSQFDQLLMNLCINARDAINGGGRIHIETREIAIDAAYCATKLYFVPGDYAVLSVSDNGSGMDNQTQAKIFEPFFTTKNLGQGTGLGLATVYGIVKQNNGFIHVYSEPGHGTTFSIYLPLSESLNPADKKSPDNTIATSTNATILVVEDEKHLLHICQTMLLDLGYKVLAAGTPEEALLLAADHKDRIDLLLTDVVMPGMNGRELQARMQKNNPGIKCLFMSGYTANVISHHGVLDPDVYFIQKPFTFMDIGKKILETLNRNTA
jgi:signal transduction histidine kinase/ActR/RegA family two-component response regulator